MQEKIKNNMVIAALLLAVSALYVSPAFCAPAPEQPPYDGGGARPADDRGLVAKVIDNGVRLCTTKNAFNDYMQRVQGKHEELEWKILDSGFWRAEEWANTEEWKDYVFGVPMMVDEAEYYTGKIYTDPAHGNRYRFLQAASDCVHGGKNVYMQNHDVKAPAVAGEPVKMRVGAVVIGATLATAVYKIIKYARAKLWSSKIGKVKKEAEEEQDKKETLKSTPQRVGGQHVNGSEQRQSARSALKGVVRSR